MFLLNLEPARLTLDGEAGLELNAKSPRAVRSALSIGFSSRKCLRQARGSEVAFRSVIAEGARVRFEVGFGSASASKPSPDEGKPFLLELLARSAAGEEALLWSEELVPPAPGAERPWKAVECPLPFESGDLVFRTGGEPEPRIQRDAPGWANPRIVTAQPRTVSAPPKGRNVIVFLVDTLRADRIGPLGHASASTPVLDALARESILFTQANSAAPWTKSSVASLMTSQYPSRHGAEAFPDRLRDSEVTLARVFGEAGYATGAVGANTWVFTDRFNLTSGFQETIEVIDQEREGGAHSDAVVAEAIDWILRRGDKPFFLYIHALDPHEPYVPPPEERARLVPTYTGPLTGRLEGDGTHSTRKKSEVSPEDLDFLRALYDAEIAFTDRMLGHLVRRLRELGLWDELTLVFTADHGEEFLERGYWSHGRSLYQEQLHVPLILKPPASAGRAPRVRADPVSLLDVAPTLLELAGIPAAKLPAGGQSLLSYGDGVRRSAPILAELHKDDQHAYSLRDGDLKYITFLAPRPREELYDLRSDPGETRNLLATTDPALLEALRKLVAEHQGSAPVRGLYLEILGDGTPADVQVRITSPDPELDHNLIAGERDTDSITATGGAGRSIHARLTLGAEDRRDVVFLDPDPGVRLRVLIKVDGAPLDPARILQGPGLEPALTSPVQLLADSPVLLMDAPPAPLEPRPGLWCRIWQLRPSEQEAVIDPETEASLRALGYGR